MRVLFIITRSDRVGGASVHVKDMAQRLREDGHDAAVAVGGSGPYLDILEEAGVPVEPLSMLKGGPPNPLWDPLAVAELVRVVRRSHPDIVSTHSTKAGFLGRLACLLTGVPCLFTAHGWAFTEGKDAGKRRLYRFTEKLASRWTERIITVSRYDRELALEEGVAPEEKITVIHNGMKDEAPVRRQGGGSDVEIVTVARFERQKDYMTLLEACRRLGGDGWRLTAVGDGPRQDTIRGAAKEIGLSDQFDFAGYRDDVPQILAESDVFVLFSRWEGLPRSIIEAMRAGLPVVATDVGGVSELLESGRTGYVIPPGDDRAGAEALGQLIGSAELRAEMGGRGRRRYEEHFTFEHMYRKTSSLYRQILGH